MEHYFFILNLVILNTNAPLSNKWINTFLCWTAVFSSKSVHVRNEAVHFLVFLDGDPYLGYLHEFVEEYLTDLDDFPDMRVGVVAFARDGAGYDPHVVQSSDDDDRWSLHLHVVEQGSLTFYTPTTKCVCVWGAIMDSLCRVRQSVSIIVFAL